MRLPWKKAVGPIQVLEAQMRAKNDAELKRWRIEHMRDHAIRIGDKYLMRSKEINALLELMLMRENIPEQQKMTHSDWLKLAIDKVAPGRWDHVQRQEKMKRDIWEAQHKVVLDAADADLLAAALEGFPESIPTRFFDHKNELEAYDLEYEVDIEWRLSERELTVMRGFRTTPSLLPIRQGEPCRIYARTLDNKVYRRKVNGSVIAVVERFSSPEIQKYEVVIRVGQQNVTIDNKSQFLRRDVNGHLRMYIPLNERHAAVFTEMKSREDLNRYCMMDVVADKAMRDYINGTEDDDMMSRDRVEFQFGGYGTNTSSSEAACRAAVEALGLDSSVASQAARIGIGGTLITVRCRPSQFARFLILRNQYGGVNDFRGLKAKLVPAVEEPVVVDVAANRNSVDVRS